jgi:hypothetical protein
MTPAAQTIVRASMRSPPEITPSASHEVTLLSSRTSTPSFSSARSAADDEDARKEGSRREPASIRTIRAFRD